MKKDKNYLCPCCGQIKNRTEVKKALQLLHEVYRLKMPKYYSSFKGELIDHLRNEQTVWACDTCFNSNLVIRANPSLIFYSGEYPLVHFDEEKECSKCQEAFIFTKEEKKQWYENFGFYFESTRKYCSNCQKIINEEKVDHKRLSTLLKNPSKLNKAELEEIAQIYLRMGKEEKAKKYMTLSRRKK